MTVEELRKKEFWVLVAPDGQVDDSAEQVFYLSREEAQRDLDAYYLEDDGYRVERLGRIAEEREEDRS